MEYVKQQLQAIETGVESDEESLMQLLLKSCSARDASIVAVDAMAAGIDTVSQLFIIDIFKENHYNLTN